jgi:hypothetical protein
VAEEGPQTKYEVEKKTKVNHASVHEAVKHLLDMGAFEGEKVGITRVGLSKVKYKLTFFGFCAAALSPVPKNYRKIAENWGHLEPLMLGKWNYFVQKVGKDEAEDFLYGGACVVKRICKPEEVEELTARISEGKTNLSNETIYVISKPEELVERFREEAVFALFERFRDVILHETPEFMPALKPVYGELPTLESFEKWVEAFEGDPQLKVCAAEYAKKHARFASQEMKWAQFLKEKFLKLAYASGARRAESQDTRKPVQ